MKVLFVISLLWGASAFPASSLNVLLSGAYQNYFEEEVNPLNQVLKKPRSTFQLELQPSLNIGLEAVPLKWVAKPKVKIRQSNYSVENQSTTDSIGEYGFWENYLSLQAFPQWEISAGIINLQWGPSELINPSQFLWLQQTLLLEPFQFTQGIEMLQVLWTPSQNFTLNLIKELKPFQWSHSDEPAGEIRRDSLDRTLLRMEFSSVNGAVVVGQVAGVKNSDRRREQYGGYALWNYTEGTQIYTDYLVQKGSEVIYWDGTRLIRPFEESSELFLLGVFGHRWTFRNGIEWKIEWISNSFGKTKGERDLELATLEKTPGHPSALLAYSQRNYIFPGKNYVYNSLRWDDPEWLKHLFASSALYLRDLISLADNSHFLNLELQSSLSDHWSQAFGCVKTLGSDKGELNTELDVFFIYVLKRSF
jgi:hypothetical protein